MEADFFRGPVLAWEIHPPAAQSRGDRKTESPPGAHLLEGQHQVASLSLCDGSSTAMMARGGESRRIAPYERGPLVDILLLSPFFFS